LQITFAVTCYYLVGYGFFNIFNLTEEKILSKLSESFINYTRTIVENKNGRIDLMPAGNYTNDFLNKINTFNWKEYYEKFDGGNHIEIWKKYLNSLDYDFILIDSRTGIHDYSGICNIQMPDANVIVITPTNQSFSGSEKVIEGIITSKYVNNKRRQPIILPIFSRIDPNSNELKGKWIEKFKNRFNKTIRDWINFRFDSQQSNITLLLEKEMLEIEINDFIDNTYLEYKTDISFGEKVLFTSKKEKILENTYQKVVSHISHLHYIAKAPNASFNRLDFSSISTLLNRRNELFDNLINLNKLLLRNSNDELLNEECKKIEKDLRKIFKNFKKAHEYEKIKDLFNIVSTHNEKIELLKRYFKIGDLDKVRDILDIDKTEQELEGLLQKISTHSSSTNYDVKRLTEISTELLIAAKILSIKNAFPLKSKVYYLKKSLQASRTAENTFEYSYYLLNNKSYLEAATVLNESLLLYKKLAKKEYYKYYYRVGLCYNNLANVNKNINNLNEAEKLYNQAISIFEEINYDNSRHKHYYASILINIGELYVKQHKYQKAIKYYDDALKVYRNLSKINPQLYLLFLSKILNSKANTLKRQNQYNQAETLYEEALAIQKTLSIVFTPRYSQVHVATTLNNLANLQRDKNEFSKAEKSYEEALAIRRQLAEVNPQTYLPDVAMTLNNLANLQRDKNEFAKAEKSYEEALAIRRQLAEVNPQTYLPDVAMTLNNLAVLQSDKNEFAKAEKSYEEALTIRRQLAEVNPQTYLPDVAGTLNNLANLQQAKNEFAKAEKSYAEALANYRQLAEVNPQIYLPGVATTLNNLANLQQAKNEFAKAEKSYEEAFAIRRQLAEVNPQTYLPDLATTLNNLAILQRVKNEFEKAEKSFEEALAIYRRLAEVNPQTYLPDLAMTQINLAIFYLQSKPNKVRSLELVDEAIMILLPFQQLGYIQNYLKSAFQVLNALGVDIEAYLKEKGIDVK
jgi:tetratricopeptide (TPR) repeat protein